MTHRSKIQDEYRRRRDRLAITFPAAHRFLMALEESGPPLWISTASNAHVYRGDAYLMYVRLRTPEASPPSLVLRARPNLRIAASATDRSRALFDARLPALAARHAGEGLRHHADHQLEVRTSVPPAFFDELLSVLCALDV